MDVSATKRAIEQTMNEVTFAPAISHSTHPDKICMSVRQFAERMQISLPTAYTMTRSEGFPKIKAGRKLLIPIAAFEQWLEKATTK